MTRPGGVTPVKSLPYPGSGAIHADTPKSIQSLAEAISRQLTSVQGGYRLAYWVGNLALDSAGTSPVLSFPGELASVVGFIVTTGSFMGGAYQVGWPSYGTNKFTMNSSEASLTNPGPVGTFANKTISACVVAWGPSV